MRDRQSEVGRQIPPAVAAFVIIIAIGAVGYYLLERGWSFVDALYMATITVSTVGLREVHEMGPGSRIFTMVLILFGVGAFMYLATALANYVIAGEMRGFWSQRRMNKKIAQLSEHYIVCAFGRMGSEVADEFNREGRPVVVIDTSEEALVRAVEAGLLVIEGDAKSDDILRQAGIERARGLVTCLDDDAGNLMVVLSARTMSEKLFIVSRTNLHDTTSKLLAAGANRVLWPYGLGGRRMAQMALRPNVVEFLEVVMHDEELELLLEELTIAIDSELQDVAIGASMIREKTGVMVVAIRQRTGKMLVAPSADTVLAAGDIVVTLGTREQLSQLHKMAC